MITLVIIQAALLFLAILFPEHSKIFHTSISALFFFYAGMKVFYHKVSSFLLFFAMAFCFLGDLLLAKIIPFPDSFLGGMGAFAMGQVVFILHFTSLLREGKQKIMSSIFYQSILVMGTILLVVWIGYVIPTDTDFMLTGAILVYGALLVVMAAFAMQLMSLSRKYLLVGLGGVSFLISDMVIALTSVVGISIPEKKHIIWVTYTLALMGIIYGLEWVRTNKEGITFAYEDETASE